MNPWLITVALLAVMGAGWGGFRLGVDHEQASRSREEKVVAKAVEAATTASARAIAGIKVTNTTIYQELQREIHKEPVYIDCRHSAVGLQRTNEALEGRAQRPGAGQLPAADAPAR